MQEQSKWRVELARELAKVYADRPGLRMMVLGGSASRNRADEFSDLDIVVYWDELDEDFIRSLPLKARGAEKALVFPHGPGVLIEEYYFDGLKVDLGHLRMEAWEQMLQTVLVDHKPDMDVIGSIDGMSHAIPLLEEEEVLRQQERLLEYPEELALNVIRRHRRFFVGGCLENQGWARNEWLFYWDAVTATLKNLLGMLSGLNRVYYSPGEPRWYRPFLEELKTAPPDMATRVDHILTTPGPEALTELRLLLLDTLEIVRAQYPAEVSDRMLQAIGGNSVNAVSRRPDVLANGCV